MKKIIYISVLLAVALAIAWTACGAQSQNVVDKFTLKLWNGSYYCNLRFPDGTSAELNSKTDLNFSQWQAKIKTAWEAHQVPPPGPEPTLTAATVEDLKAEIVKRKLTATDLGLDKIAEPVR